MQVCYWLPNHATRDAASLDVPGYYAAAAHVLAGEPIYGEAFRQVQGGTAPYIYPPPFAVAIAPLALLGQARFQVVWYVGILLAFWAYAAALVRLTGRALTAARLLTAGAILQVFPGTSTTMSFGNADLLVWATCAAALRPGGAVWGGVAGASKVYPAWVLVTKRPREALVGAAVAAGILGVSFAVVGVASLMDWLRLLGTLSSRVDWPTNVSFVHLVGYGGRAAPLLPLLGVPLVAWSMRKSSRELAGAAVLIAAVFFAPVCWLHYAPMLLMPAAALLAVRAEGASPFPR